VRIPNGFYILYFIKEHNAVKVTKGLPSNLSSSDNFVTSNGLSGVLIACPQNEIDLKVSLTPIPWLDLNRCLSSSTKLIKRIGI